MAFFNRIGLSFPDLSFDSCKRLCCAAAAVETWQIASRSKKVGNSSENAGTPISFYTLATGAHVHLVFILEQTPALGRERNLSSARRLCGLTFRSIAMGSVLKEKTFGAHAIKRVTAGAHLPTP